ncbi:hypothetical protein BUALT_Bualt14G0003400 [Buddleja alternifolia]|uniref:Glycosyltransferase n=1 Tax=Buddleja alternifolia TaxID=168488 RepID=A0AAV6WP69_9LAMI|nr:hypothetical protein BUALT_Bualt14G0003400 [Buddleja alternifolia]
MKEVTYHIALLPPPGFIGHLIPFIELTKKLVFQHNFSVTLIIPHDGSSMKPQKSLLQALPPTINQIFLPPVSTNDLPDNLNVEILLTTRVIRSLPALRQTLSSLTESGSRPTALVVDLFAPYAIDVAKEFEIPAYIFYVIAANELSLAMDVPYKLGESDPIQLPGSIVLNPDDYPDSLKEANSEVREWAMNLCKKQLLAEGIIVNSFLELESEAFKDLLERRRHQGIPPIYPVGPLIRTGSENESGQGSECLKWLDQQPPKSVIFVSFGSGGTLSMEQFTELALALEMSQQRFVWVAATRVKENENGIVERGHISELVKGLMEGEEGISLRKRMNDVKNGAAKALSEEGSSTQALAQEAILVHCRAAPKPPRQAIVSSGRSQTIVTSTPAPPPAVKTTNVMSLSPLNPAAFASPRQSQLQHHLSPAANHRHYVVISS